MLDFRIDTFLAVCHHMSFTRAAEELHITQPAVSQHIHCLENAYAARFFDYQGKKMRLTPAGEAFLTAATTMKHDDIYLREKLQELGAPKKRLVFGATLTIGSFVLPRPLSRYLLRHPETSVELVVANTRELLRKINAGTIDFALVEGFFAKNDYDSMVYSKESFIAVCSPAFRFRREPHTVEDLLGEPLLLREPGSGTRQILEKYLETRNLTLQEFNTRVQISDIGAIKALAELGSGVTFLYKATVREELKRGTLREIPLEDFQITHDFTFLWRKNSIFAERYRDLFQSLLEEETV